MYANLSKLDDSAWETTSNKMAQDFQFHENMLVRFQYIWSESEIIDMNSFMLKLWWRHVANIEAFR